MSKTMSRGEKWLRILTNDAEARTNLPPSVKAVDYEDALYLAVVPDPENKYPRARNGEVGLLEGWTLAKVINEAIDEDTGKTVKRPIIAVVDVTSQAYGRREEAFGIHQALAGSAAAYARARMEGHPLVSLVVGKAMSGAFLAHGYQGGKLIALNDPAVLVHAMGKASAARITLRSVDDLDKFASTVPPMAYDVKNYATLGLLSSLLEVPSDNPTEEQKELVRKTVKEAIENPSKTLSNRLGSEHRKASQIVREQMKAAWNN